MEFIIWVETGVAGRTADIQQVASVERPAGIKAPEEIGLFIGGRQSRHQRYSASHRRDAVSSGKQTKSDLPQLSVFAKG